MDLYPGQTALSDDGRHHLAFWTVACAERALSVFEATAPDDLRPRDAIEHARAFAQGGRRTAALRTAASAAYAAAREAGDAAAAAAARSSGLAAATAFIHAHASTDQEKHALGPAVYGALACELASPDDPTAADEEIRWATDHASPSVREVVSRLPARAAGRSRLEALYYRLDTALRR